MWGGRNDSDEESRLVREKVRAAFSSTPPTIGVVGTSGVGKSSTLNVMFKTRLPTSDTVRCTREFTPRDLGLKVKRGQAEGEDARLRVIDAPGLGEDIRQDPEYLAMYREHLPGCDVILYVLSARSRAVALDQRYLKELQEFHPKMVFGLNQVDLIEPMDWIEQLNIPTVEMERKRDEVVEDRAERVSHAAGRRVTVHPYSAKRGYMLESLFAALIENCPAERRWLFDSLKNFTFTDFIPAGALGDVTTEGV